MTRDALLDTRFLGSLERATGIREHMERAPWTTLAVGFGVGFLFGGGILRPLASKLFRLGVTMATLPFVRDELVRKLGDALGVNDALPAPEAAPEAVPFH